VPDDAAPGTLSAVPHHVLPADLAAVLDALPDGHALFVAERDADGHLEAVVGLYMNPAGLALRGTTLEGFVGTDLLERTRERGDEAAVAGIMAALDAGTQMRRTLVSSTTSGGPSFEVNASRLELGGQEMLSLSFRDVTQELHSRRRMQQAVEISTAHSRTDELTGLPNRRGWQSVVDRAFAAGEAVLTLAIADIDRFKAYNDRRGHLLGDALLRDLAATWSRHLAPPQCLARLGGEEFSFLLPGLASQEAADLLAQLSTLVPDEQTVSIGVASRREAESVSEVLSRADEALYVAKRGGRARVVVAP
jgi:diguanylate cyclase (GGDEF)-like protein